MSSPPTKPPRGVKQGKETSGLLMSVIRTLSASETNEQREKERAKLEKEYKKSDARLDELVAAHASEIMEVMQKFSAVGQAITLWGQHCDAATARLGACRGLLKLRRDDLKRLWTTARTHHYALQMLTDIERVVVCEREARALMGAGRVVGAAHTLTAALDRVDSALAHVTALTITRQHLQGMKMSLVDIIVGNIRRCVYRGELPTASQGISSRRRAAALLAELTKSEEVTDAYLQEITPEYEASLTEEDKTFETTVMLSLEALGVLEQLQEATEKFKVEIQNELLEVIDIVSRRIIEEGDVELEVECEEDDDISDSESATETSRPLVRLITILGEEFRACAARNRRLIQLWRAALHKYKLSDTCLHTEQHYWSAVQQVMQLLLTEYLDIESVNLAGARSTAAAATYTDSLRLSDYFAKKKPQRRRPELFKFNNVSPSSRSTVRRERCTLVVAPRPDLLHAIMPPLHTLCALVEARPGVGECSLRAFITDYVRTGESERLATLARQQVDAALTAPTAWRERTTAPDEDGSCVVYSCCVWGWRAVRSAARGARACGSCGGLTAARATLAAAGALAAGARAAHSRRVPAGSRAARWLADDDIVRFLQALPNWRAVVNPSQPCAPHDLKQAYEREAEILGSSLGDGTISRNEIISSPDVLEDIAVLCESMDWLATKIRSVPSLLSGGGPGGGVKVTDKFINDINSAAMIFDEISHKCLLLLHLEVRIECFYYLGGGVGGGGAADGGESGECEGGALLCRALVALQERVSVLRAGALRYVVSGAGEMMSAGVVWAGAARPARLAALRHCLAALHLPHDGLTRAHHYLHLLEQTPQEIIATIREKGAQFSELEYLNAFKVIGTKRGLSQSDMKQYLKQLSDALGHVGVTV